MTKIENQGKSLSSSGLFSQWNENTFLSVLLSAKEISGVYVTNYDLLNAHAEEFKDFLARGGILRVIFVKPNTTAAKMASQRGYGADAQPWFEDPFIPQCTTEAN